MSEQLDVLYDEKSESESQRSQGDCSIQRKCPDQIYQVTRTSATGWSTQEPQNSSVSVSPLLTLSK